MAFGAQQIYPSDFSPNQAIGVDLPLNGNAVFKSTYQTKDAIKNNLINFFLTNPGERYLNPELGGGLRKFIFEQIKSNNIDSLKTNLNFKLKQYFSNINIVSLDILSNEDENRIIVQLKYSIPNTNIKDEILLQF
jgi:phage baseplate assembly protein W